MNITHIHVTASTGFNHPHESYSNFKPAISLTATLAESESALDKAVELQALAHRLVMAQKDAILDEIEAEQDRKNHARDYQAAAREVPRCVVLLKRDDIEPWRREEGESSLRGYLAAWTRAHEAEPDLYPAPPTLESLELPEPKEDGE